MLLAADCAEPERSCRLARVSWPATTKPEGKLAAPQDDSFPTRLSGQPRPCVGIVHREIYIKSPETVCFTLIVRPIKR